MPQKPKTLDKLLEECKTLARQAGAAVMEVYETGDFAVEFKADQSPLTTADTLSNRILVEGLSRYTSYPIISEEGSHSAQGDTFWLIDPLDGTKEFLKHNGEFTINIGLIQDGQPVLGVVYAPGKKVLYFGVKGTGAFKETDDQSPLRIAAVYTEEVPTIVVSRSHLDASTRQFLATLGAHQTAEIGSSLKLCLVAEGAATLYPRFAPTYLWDTAAADAIVRAAGGSVYDLHERPLAYSPSQTLLNPSFIVTTGNANARLGTLPLPEIQEAAD